MIATRRRPLTAAFIVTVAACGDVPPDEASDVPVVSQVVDRDRVLQLEEELRLDGSRDDLAFFRIVTAALDSEGNMYVLDAGNGEIVVTDPSGGSVRKIGRRGQGPGEFMRAMTMWLSHDTIGVVDEGNRVHFFRTDGSLISTQAHMDLSDDSDFWMIGSIAGGDQGWFVRASAFFRNDADGDPTNQPPLQRSKVFRVTAEGPAEATDYYFEYEPPGRMVGAFFVQPPFLPSPMSVMDGLGRIHMAEADDYVIDVYDASGGPLYRVANQIERNRVTGDDLEQWKEDRACPPGAPECDPSRTELALSMDIPEYKPVVGRMVGFPSGYVAIMRRDSDPDPSDNLIMGEYDIFDPEGRFMGRLPSGLSPRWFDGETLVATEWDDFMVPSMIRYRVVSQ